MALRYDLTGSFLESCNCTVVCPCWVDDTPDEDFCAGLFAWTFDPGSVIENHDVGGRSLVSVTVHGDSRRGGGSSSAIYVDQAVDATVAGLLIQAFSGRGGGPLRDLANVTGQVVDGARAEVTVGPAAGGWQIRVRADGSRLVDATGGPKRFDASPTPLTLAHTALSKELGIGGESVVANETTVLRLDVAALPGAPIDVEGRSAMSGRFRYHGDGAEEPDDPAGSAPEAEGEADEGD